MMYYRDRSSHLAEKDKECLSLRKPNSIGFRVLKLWLCSMPELGVCSKCPEKSFWSSGRLAILRIWIPQIAPVLSGSRY
jgi:hypothetical protein